MAVAMKMPARQRAFEADPRRGIHRRVRERSHVRANVSRSSIVMNRRRMSAPATAKLWRAASDPAESHRQRKLENRLLDDARVSDIGAEVIHWAARASLLASVQLAIAPRDRGQSV
jgi:hypothetical protein